MNCFSKDVAAAAGIICIDSFRSRLGTLRLCCGCSLPKSHDHSRDVNWTTTHSRFSKRPRNLHDLLTKLRRLPSLLSISRLDHLIQRPLLLVRDQHLREESSSSRILPHFCVRGGQILERGVNLVDITLQNPQLLA